MHCTKISSEFDCQGQRLRSLGKNKKVRHFVQESSSGAQSSCGIFFGSSPRGCSPLCRCVNQRMLSSLVVVMLQFVLLRYILRCIQSVIDI